MMFKITTPDDVVIEIDTHADDAYLKDLTERGYKVERVLNICTSCEG